MQLGIHQAEQLLTADDRNQIKELKLKMGIVSSSSSEFEENWEKDSSEDQPKKKISEDSEVEDMGKAI